MKSAEEIHSLYLQRKAEQGPLAAVMREVRDVYNGDVVVPLPELEKGEKVAIANLLAQGLDQLADRIASTVPDPQFPTRRAGVSEQDRARDRRAAVLGWWSHSRMDLKLYRRGRHLLGYGTSPVLIRPDFSYGAPQWMLRDPLATYAGPSADPDDPCVPDAIFAVDRSFAWLKNRYDIETLAKPEQCKPDELFTVLEYVDGDELAVVVIGKAHESDRYGSTGYQGARELVLERVANRAEMCTAIVPGRISLDRRRGQFDGMIGMYQAQAKLFALEQIAVERGVFPDEWLIARQNETPEILTVADGRRGEVGVVKGGDLRQVAHNPGYKTDAALAQLERAQRLTAGIPAEFGGESQSNVRTGRRGENILSATIDFGILHAQRVLASSLEAENRCAIAVDKAYHNNAKSFYVSWYKAKGTVDYTPSELFVTDQHVVSYAQAGTDINGIVVSGGQRVGMGTLSKRGFMEMDPLVDDPEREADRIVAEGLEQALLASVQQQASAGAIPPADLARIMQLVREDKKDLAGAVDQAQREAQERQAQQAPPDSPGAQPGLAQPGMGAEMAPIPEEPMGPSPENLSRLLASLRRPQALTAPGEGPRPEAMV